MRYSMRTDGQTDTTELIPLFAILRTRQITGGGGERYAVAQLVEALRYKPEGRGVRFPMVSLEFFIDIILPAAL